MKYLKIAATGALLVGGFSSVSIHAMPLLGEQYYVRPVLRVGGGEIIDGLVQNGATVATQSQGVTGNSRSEVNLREGTVKMYAEEFTNSAVGLQTFGGFGERITVRNGAGTSWGIDFGVEGEVFGDLGFRAPGAPAPTIVYNVGVVVLEAGLADYSNFLSFARDPCFGQDPLSCTPAPAALANEFSQLQYEVPVEDFFDGDGGFYDFLSTAVSVDIAIDSNLEQFDLFTYTNVFMAFDTLGPQSGLQNYVMDFENTARYTQQFAPNVDVFSSSGEFLGLTTPPNDPPGTVPTPGVLQLFGLGLAALFMGRRRKQA
ncbi:MAG: hypothetical protein AB8C02_05890 [Halioglobus sp.]